MGLVMMGANIPAGLQWKTMDGSFVTMTQEPAGQVFAAAAASDAALFARAEQIKATMDADPCRLRSVRACVASSVRRLIWAYSWRCTRPAATGSTA